MLMDSCAFPSTSQQYVVSQRLARAGTRVSSLITMSVLVSWWINRNICLQDEEEKMQLIWIDFEMDNVITWPRLIEHSNIPWHNASARKCPFSSFYYSIFFCICFLSPHFFFQYFFFKLFFLVGIISYYNIFLLFLGIFPIISKLEVEYQIRLPFLTCFVSGLTLIFDYNYERSFASGSGMSPNW